MVPVNLRKYFSIPLPAELFGWIEPGYLFAEEYFSFTDVVQSVSAYFHEELTKERLGQRIEQSYGPGTKSHPAYFPSELKNLGMHWAHSLQKDVSAVFSNLGVVSMPKEYVPYISRFGVFTSTPKIELSMCSFEDDLVLSFASGFPESEY